MNHLPVIEMTYERSLFMSGRQRFAAQLGGRQQGGICGLAPFSVS